MSFIHRMILNKVGFRHLPEERDLLTEPYPNLANHLHFSQTDHASKGQVVVATQVQPAVEYMSSNQLHEASQQALERLRELQEVRVV